MRSLPRDSSNYREREDTHFREAEERILASLSEFGLSAELIGEDIISRLVTLDERTKIFMDARNMKVYAEHLFSFYDRGERAAGGPLDDLERKEIIEGILFCDIGKTGPKHATPEQQQAIADLFAVENIQEESTSIRQVLGRYFVDRAGEMAEKLRAVGVDPEASMRKFWDTHVVWSVDIATKTKGIEREIVPIVASHHELRGINPGGIVRQDGAFQGDFGKNRHFGRAEKLVHLLDLYDALRRRGGRTHAEAIAELREKVAQSDRFKDDEQFFGIIGDMERVPPPPALEDFYERACCGE